MITWKVMFLIPWKVEMVDCGEKFIMSSGSHEISVKVKAMDKSNAKLKALQKIREENSGVHWIRDLNKNPFSCIKKIICMGEKYNER